MVKRKAARVQNFLRRWSVAGLASDVKAARRASPAVIRHHVREAVRRKADALAALSDPDRLQRACDMSHVMWREAAERSIHVLARTALEYHRHRAFAGVNDANSGSYAPAGWPIDLTARDKWLSLQ